MPAIDYSKLLWTPFGNSPTNTFDRNNAPLPGLTSRSVQTLRVDQNGNPIMPPKPSASAMNANDTVRDIPASSQPYIDATNPIDMFKQFGIMPSAPQNPALGAIDDLTGSGRSTSSPFPLPSFRSPAYAPPAEITGATTPLPQMQPGMFGRGQPSMQWEQAVSSGPAPAGDPWGGMRIGDQSPPLPAFTNPSATYFDRSTGSFVTGRQPPPLPRRPSAEIHARLMAQQSPRGTREQRIADAFRTDGVVAHRYADDADFLRNNTPGGRPDERSLMRAAQREVANASRRK